VRRGAVLLDVRCMRTPFGWLGVASSVHAGTPNRYAWCAWSFRPPAPGTVLATVRYRVSRTSPAKDSGTPSHRPDAWEVDVDRAQTSSAWTTTRTPSGRC